MSSADRGALVDNYENYVHVQSEAALRNLATSYPYDTHEDHEKSLRGSTAEVAAHLKQEVQERLTVAGVEVVEARISHLAYAPEIAASMLQRQQAAAIVAARQRIVDGAVGMVEMALERLAAKGTVKLDEERKAAMVSNLLVVLFGERAASRWSTPERFTSRGLLRKTYPLRIDEEVLDGIRRWANDDLRSLNGQIEFLLREALRRSGRTTEKEARPPASGQPTEPRP